MSLVKVKMKKSVQWDGHKEVLEAGKCYEGVPDALAISWLAAHLCGEVPEGAVCIPIEAPEPAAVHRAPKPEPPSAPPSIPGGGSAIPPQPVAPMAAPMKEDKP